MSRFADPDEWWGPKPDKAAIVREKLASVGISIDDASVLPEPAQAGERFGPPVPDWWLWRHDFAITGGGLVISLELFKKLGGRLDRPALHNRDLPEGAKNEADDLEGYEAMIND